MFGLVWFSSSIEQSFPPRYLWLHRDRVGWLSSRSVAQACVCKRAPGTDKPRKEEGIGDFLPPWT